MVLVNELTLDFATLKTFFVYKDEVQYFQIRGIQGLQKIPLQ